LDALLDLGKGSLVIRATLDEIAYESGLSRSTTHRAILRLITARLINWDRIEHNFVLQFTLRGIHANAELPRLAELDNADAPESPISQAVPEPPAASQPEAAQESETAPEILSHSETENSSHFDAPNTREEKVEENNNNPEPLLSIFVPTEEPKPTGEPDPRLAKVVTEVLEYIPEATPGMVNLAIADFELECVERAITAFAMTKVRSNAWGCFLGILRNYKRQGGPPRVVPPVKIAAAKAAQSAVDSAVPTVEEYIDGMINLARRPGSAGESWREKLRGLVESGEVPRERIPSEVLCLQPTKKLAGESITTRPPQPAGALALPCRTPVYRSGQTELDKKEPPPTLSIDR
jgi:hypothetical protein